MLFRSPGGLGGSSQADADLPVIAEAGVGVAGVAAGAVDAVGQGSEVDAVGKHVFRDGGAGHALNQGVVGAGGNVGVDSALVLVGVTRVTVGV